MSGFADIMPSSGKKKVKKGAKAAKDKKKNPPPKGRKNNKAFNVANIVSAKRTMQRNLDKEQQKEVVPLRNREEDIPPPALIVIMGPKGVGKSTLIRSLVKIYSGQNITDTTGPITVVAGNKRRLTFFECPLDLYSMTDLAKVADLVLLMIDASYGFEMETFEYLNLLQLHGFPKVMGVLTNLDKFRNNKSLQSAKKAIKHRFWTEIYKGAKMFDFMGTKNGKYRKHEVKRLSLHVSRVKFRPLVWRNSHPYLVVDRVEDVTPVNKQNGDGDKEVTLYGYVRGSHFKPNMKVHLVGAGDFDVHSMSALPDPCPLQQMEMGEDGKLRKARSLSKKKENMLYAPMANVGRVSMDKDSMYIELRNINYSKKDSLYLPDQQGMSSMEAGTVTGPMELLRSMQDVKEGVDQQLMKSKGSLALFSNSANAQSYSDSEEEEDEEGESDQEEEDDYDDDEEEDMEAIDEVDEDDEDVDDEEDEEENGEDVSDDEDDLEEESDDEDDDYYEDDASPAVVPTFARAKFGGRNEEGLGRTLTKLQPRTQEATDVMKMIYGESWLQTNMPTSSENTTAQSSRNTPDENDDEDDFFVVKKEKQQRNADGIQALDINAIDSSRYVVVQEPKWQKLANYKSNNSMYYSLKQRFVTGGWKKAITAKQDGDGDGDGDGDESGSEIANGDFEDLEAIGTGTSRGEQDGDNDSDDQEEHNEEIDKQLRSLNAQKKAAFKSSFDESYDRRKSGDKIDGKEVDEDEDGNDSDENDENENSMVKAAQLRNEVQHERNRREFGEEGELARNRYEGFRQGLYVRMHLKNVPVEFLQCFNASRPVLVGGLLPSETAMGFLTARVKRHRWHKRVLKSNDPLIFSIGWRRYQSLPIYTTSDQNERERFLKYTPEHMHCIATFYGPLVAPNTGILAYQKVDNSTSNFRIALTGTALEQRATPNIVKKLKLVGTPMKIYKNTAFISGMFTSALEVAKFEHAKIKTVSGIRGSIKKAVNEKNDMQGMDSSGSRELGRLPPGTFRATFEDKILMSDIVICRLWVNVEPKKFYNPVFSALASGPVKAIDGNDNASHGVSKPAEGMPLMRSTAQIRKEDQVPQPVNKDSVYKPVVRVQREFRKLTIPAKLQEALPFASKPKHEQSKKRDSYLARRAVVLEPEEKKNRAMLQMLSTIRKDKDQKRFVAHKERAKEKQKKDSKESERFAEIHKEEKKRKYREQGLDSARKAKRQAK